MPAAEVTKFSKDVLKALSSSGPWTPAMKNGEPVPAKLFLKDNFWFPREKSQEVKTAEKEVFFIVEEMPQFNNGDPAVEFKKYVDQNLQYPKEEASKGISGRVIVQFVVNTDGNVSNAEVVRGASAGLDREALRIIESSPAWTPGKQRGQAVSVLFTFPVNFVIQENRTTPVDSSSHNMISRKIKPEFSYSRNSVKVINNPWHGHTSAPYLKISRIELHKKSTVLYFDVTFRPNWWIRVPGNTYIKPDNNGKRLYIKEAEGIPLNEKFFMPDSGRTSFKLYFPPIDEDVSYIDYGEEEPVQGGWYINNIKLIE